MYILIILLAFSITTSCILHRTEHGHPKGDANASAQRYVPTGCADQLSFVREEEIVDEYLVDTYITHRRYSFKHQRKCNASVIISYDQEIVSDPIAFMNAKNITCDTDHDGSLLLNFPRPKNEKYQQVKFPCTTKEIIITKIPSWEDWDGYVQESLQETTSDAELDAYMNTRRGRFLRWFGYSIAKGLAFVARGYGALFSGHYKTFRKKVLGGLAIVYSDHQQATLRNPTSMGILRKSGTKEHSYGAMGISKEGSLVYHIMVDKDGKKQMLYPQKLD